MEIETRFIVRVRGVEFHEGSRENAFYRAVSEGRAGIAIEVKRYIFGEPVRDDVTATVYAGDSVYAGDRIVLRAQSGSESLSQEFNSLLAALRVADGWCRCE